MNKTRWSSKVDMLRRYVRLLPYLDVKFVEGTAPELSEQCFSFHKNFMNTEAKDRLYLFVGELEASGNVKRLFGNINKKNGRHLLRFDMLTFLDKGKSVYKERGTE